MSSRSITDCVVKLQEVWPLIQADFERTFPGWQLELDCTHRPPEEQFTLFKQGRAWNATSQIWEVTAPKELVTNCDGKNTVSRHNLYPSQAFDIRMRTPQRDLTWKYKSADGTVLPQWAVLTTLAEKYGIINGGSFRSILDYPHFETKGV